MVRWEKMKDYTEEDLQVLVSTQYLKADKDVQDLLEKMNMKSHYLIINQSEESKISNPYVISRKEKGLSKSRNQAIQFSDREILLLADDDVRYGSDYAKTIAKYHNEYEDDILCFYVESKNKNRPTKRLKTGKVGFLKAMRIVSFEISMKKHSIVNSDLHFKEEFGAGAKFNRGEEHIFLYEALRSGLKIRFINEKIGEAEQESSTWFSTFDETFFEIQGRVFQEMSPRYYKVLIWQYALRKYRLYSENVSFGQAIRSMLKGTV